jgi:hypothetical protein
MTATTSVSYDLTLVAHILLAVASVAIFLVLRSSAAAVAKGADAATQANRFPQRRNWAARLFHLMPITGFALVGMGGSSVSFSQPWVGIGLLLWILAAGHLEARVLPLERRLAADIAANGQAPQESGRRMGLSIDVLLLLVAAAFIVMLWQP